MYDDTMTPEEEQLLPSDSPSITAPPGGELITLPSGFKVAVRSTNSLKNRDRKSIFGGMNQNTPAVESGFIVVENILRLVITAWDVRDTDDATGQPTGSILPIPSQTDWDVLGGLSLADGTTLDAVAQKVQKLIAPNFEPNPDAASPTPPSAG